MQLLLLAVGVALAAPPFGPDVSSYQGTIDWKKVAGAGVGFGITKATVGVTYQDKYFAGNWNGMKQNGIKVRGAYHFGHPDTDANAQAAYFTKFVGPLEAGDFLVLDIEVTDKQSPTTVAQWSKDFVTQVCALTKLPPTRVWVYTGAWFWDPDAGGSSSCSAHPLWVSGYTSSPPMPKGWATWTMWQYTDKASIPGINGGVDASKFNSTQAALEKLVGL